MSKQRSAASEPFAQLLPDADPGPVSGRQDAPRRSQRTEPADPGTPADRPAPKPHPRGARRADDASPSDPDNSDAAAQPDAAAATEPAPLLADAAMTDPSAAGVKLLVAQAPEAQPAGPSVAPEAAAPVAAPSPAAAKPVGPLPAPPKPGLTAATPDAAAPEAAEPPAQVGQIALAAPKALRSQIDKPNPAKDAAPAAKPAPGPAEAAKPDLSSHEAEAKGAKPGEAAEAPKPAAEPKPAPRPEPTPSAAANAAADTRAPDIKAGPPLDAAPAAIQSAPASHVAAPPAVAAPAAPVPLAGIAVAVVANVQAGRNRFEIRLDPPELGRIDVRLHFDANGHVTSHLVVDRSETLDLLRRDAADLERSLQQAGLKTSDGGLQFSLRDQSPGSDTGSHAHRPGARVALAEAEPMMETTMRGYLRAGQGVGVDIRV